MSSIRNLRALSAALMVMAMLAPAAAQTPPSEPGGQTPPGSDAGPQRPNPSNIPEKIGPPLERSPSGVRDEKGVVDSSDRTRPAQQGLELRDPVPNTGGTAPAEPTKPQ